MNKERLTEQQILDIRERYASTSATLESLGGKHGRSKQSIQKIVKGETYQDSPGPIIGEDYERDAYQESMERISIRLPSHILEDIDRLKDRCEAKDRSSMLRKALRVGIEGLISD